MSYPARCQVDRSCFRAAGFLRSCLFIFSNAPPQAIFALNNVSLHAGELPIFVSGPWRHETDLLFRSMANSPSQGPPASSALVWFMSAALTSMFEPGQCLLESA